MNADLKRDGVHQGIKDFLTKPALGASPVGATFEVKQSRTTDFTSYAKKEEQMYRPKENQSTL